MKRIMIIGPCGAGKSTLARKLHQLTGLELLPLDQHYFKPNWVETPPEEWAIKVKALADRPSWIIDGNYGGTMDIRLQRADTVIFLDYSTPKCLFRVLKRTTLFYNKKRPDMAEGCKERFSLSFLHYVLMFRTIKRPGILKRLQQISKPIRVLIFENDNQVDHYLSTID